MSGYKEIEGAAAPIKAWVEGVPVEHAAENQLRNVASLPFIHSHIAVMPDVHFGIGATVGSVKRSAGFVVASARRDRAERAARQRPERQSPRHALFGGDDISRLRSR